MVYTPKNWVTGEVITEEALDHIEQGIANAGIFFIQLDDNASPATLDKNFAEIKAAVDNGMLPIAVNNTSEEGSTNIHYHFVNLLQGIPTISMYCVYVKDYGEDENGYFGANSPTGVLTYTTGEEPIG